MAPRYDAASRDPSREKPRRDHLYYKLPDDQIFSRDPAPDKVSSLGTLQAARREHQRIYRGHGPRLLLSSADRY